MFDSKSRVWASLFSIDLKIPILHALNLLDGVITLYFLRAGVEEMNPIMAYIYGVGPHLFLIAKVAIVSACLLFIDKKIADRYRWTISGLVAIYSLVLCWHLFGMLIMWKEWHHGLF